MKILYGIDLITKDIQDLLDSGKYYFDDIFDSFINSMYFGIPSLVKIGEHYNFINNKAKIISNIWFDDVDRGYGFVDNFADRFFRCGFLCVKRKGKWNAISRSGELLTKEWFDEMSYYKNGFAIVKLNDKYNFINKNGKLFSDTWYDGYNEALKHLSEL